MPEIKIPCSDLDEALSFFTNRLGFRLEMIYPADEPSVAVISGHGATIRLERSNPSEISGSQSEIRDSLSTTASTNFHSAPIISRTDNAKWVTGRAGMEYRDLIPGKLGGRLTASLIRLASGGEVADYVHYHKVAFQLIYCWHGRVKVVYEDQGEAFWLHPGDCVLQPPEMRHRVLENSPNTLVVELTSPAIHETWADHDLTLPTGRSLPQRDFSGQHFVYHKAAESDPVSDEFGDFESHHFGISAATGGALRVFELRSRGERSVYESNGRNERHSFLFVLTSRASLALGDRGEEALTPGDSVLIPPHTAYRIDAPANSEILCVSI